MRHEKYDRHEKREHGTDGTVHKTIPSALVDLSQQLFCQGSSMQARKVLRPITITLA